MALSVKKEKKLLLKAQKYTQAGSWKKAIQQYKLLLAEKEDDQSLHNLLGDLLSKPEVAEKEEAANEYKRAAELYEQHGFMAQAIAIYKKIIRLDPENIDNISNLAELLLKHGIQHDAAVQLQTVADQYIKENKIDRAISILERILTVTEANEKVLSTLAGLYLDKSEKIKASDIYIKLWKINQKKGDEIKCIECANKAIELNIKNIMAIQILSNHYIKIENYSEALSFLDSVNAKETNKPDIKKCYAIACSKMNRVEDAIKLFEDVCSADRDDIDSRLELGYLYLKKNNLEKAFNCWIYVGNHFYEKREFEKYKDLLETYVTYDQENIQAFEKLLHLYQILNEKNKVNELETKLRKLTESSYQTSSKDMMSVFDKIDKETVGPKELDLGLKEFSGTDISSPPESEGIELGVDLESLLQKDDKASSNLLGDIDDLSNQLGGIELDFEDNEKLQGLEIEPHYHEPEKKADKKTDPFPQITTESILVKDDYATRYELGIAYKEMGLFEEAINEFKYASQDTGLKFICNNLIGICFRDLGQQEEALKLFREILSDKSIDNNSKAAIYYDIALTYEQIRNYSEALKNYSNVRSLNPDFPDLSLKMDQLKNMISTKKTESSF
jgi:tetratricopeptide (TPR) repeat protein